MLGWASCMPSVASSSSLAVAASAAAAPLCSMTCGGQNETVSISRPGASTATRSVDAPFAVAASAAAAAAAAVPWRSLICGDYRWRTHSRAAVPAQHREHASDRLSRCDTPRFELQLLAAPTLTA